MKKFILLILAAFAGGISMVQGQEQEGKNVCGNDAAWQQAILIDPSLLQRREQMEALIDQYLKNMPYARTTDDDAVRIIPTVFHIYQEGGNENIPDANILDCIKITNEDYRRQNADATKTPAAFQPVAADTKIEFRLATIDPQGNCTNGINRIYTHRTENFSDFAKAIIDWPSNKYLNIWVGKSINNGFLVGGRVIGYAQFPLMGPSATDGVVLAYDYVGSVGVANNNYAGRDGDHEIGHYLDMIHIWGDATCGDDKCADTPTQEHENYNCPTYPSITCSNNGDMSMNYMDYSNGSCKNIWTKDQKTRMRAALDVARYSLWQQSNLIATGTDTPYVYPVTACAPKADFLPVHKNICAGSTISFGPNTTGGAATAWNWSFPGGTPSSSTIINPMVTYNNGGTYSVTLTVSNGSGSTTITRDNVAIVDYGTGQNLLPFTQDFENSLSPDWVFFNDDGGNGWQRTTRAAYSGNYSLSVQNFDASYGTSAPGSIKEFYTPSYDFTGITSPIISFRLSYGHQYSPNLDSLTIRAILHCGDTIVRVKQMGSSALAAGSGGFQPNDFVPNHDQWLLVQIQLNPIVYAAKDTIKFAGRNNVKFSFQFTSDVLSNNIYIDDINVANGVVGINEQENNPFSFNAYPVPSNESFTISYTLKHTEDLAINLYDLQGRLVRQIESKHATAGSYEMIVDAKSFNLASGVYMLKMTTGDGVLSKKIIYSND